MHSTTNLLSSTTLSPPTESQQTTTAGLPTLRHSVQPRTDAETLTHDFATDPSETPDQLHPLPASSSVIVVTSTDLPDRPPPDSNNLAVGSRQSTMSATHNNTRLPPDLTTESEIEASQATSTTGATATCPGLYFIFTPTDSLLHFVGWCVCEAKSEGLVRYPTSLAPVSGSVTVTTQCADNANTTDSSTL